MMRPLRERFVYLLIAALLLAQQGTVLHALSHGVDALKSASALEKRPDQRAPLGERHCDLCLTYAQVAAGAAPATPAMLPADDLPVAAQTFQRPTGASFARAYHSRAPPLAA